MCHDCEWGCKSQRKPIYGLKNNKKFGYFSCDGQKS